MDICTEYLPLNRYQCIKIELRIPFGDNQARARGNKKSWFKEKHLEEVLILLRGVIMKDMSIGNKQTKKKTQEKKNKLGKLSGNLVDFEYEIKRENNRQSVITPRPQKTGSGGRYQGWSGVKEKVVVLVREIPIVQPEEAVQSRSEYFYSEDKEDDNCSDGEVEDVQKTKLRNVVSKSGRQISKRKTGSTQNKRKKVVDDDGFDDDPHQRQLGSTNCPRSLENKNDERTRLKKKTPPNKRRMKMRDFVIKKNEDCANLDEKSENGAMELVKQKRRPNLSRFESKFKTGRKMKTVSYREEECSDGVMSVTSRPTCSGYNENDETEEECGASERNIADELSIEKNSVDMLRDGGKNLHALDQTFVVNNNANAEKNERSIHDIEVDQLEISAQENEDYENYFVYDQAGGNTVQSTSCKHGLHDKLSNVGNPKERSQPTTKQGQSLLTSCCDGMPGSRRQAKKCSINPVKPTLGISGVMTANLQGKLVEIKKKDAKSKVSLSYGITDDGAISAIDEKKGNDIRKLVENETINEQQLEKFGQALKTKKGLFSGKRVTEHPPFVVFDEDYWATNDIDANLQTKSVNNPGCAESSESDSSDELPNMEAITSHSSASNSQISNCSGNNGSTLNRQNQLDEQLIGIQNSSEMVSTIDGLGKETSACSQVNVENNGVETHTVKFVGIGRKRRLIGATENKTLKNEGKLGECTSAISAGTTDIKSDTGKPKRAKSKERAGIFEKLSPARSGGPLLIDQSNSRSQGVQTDNVPRKKVTSKVERLGVMERKGLDQGDFMDGICEKKDCYVDAVGEDLTPFSNFGPDVLPLGVRHVIYSEINDQRIGAKSVARDNSCSENGDMLAESRDVSVPDVLDTNQDGGIKEEAENEHDELNQNTSTRNKRFKGSYLECDSDVTRNELNNQKSRKAAKHYRDSDSQCSSQSKIIKSMSLDESSCSSIFDPCPSKEAPRKNGKLTNRTSKTKIRGPMSKQHANSLKEHNDNESDTSSVAPEVSSTSNLLIESPDLSELGLKITNVMTKSEILTDVDDAVGHDCNYYSGSSMQSKTDLGSDFPEIPCVPRWRKTLSTSTSSTTLESFGFLVSRSLPLEDDTKSSSSHQDWETLSVQSTGVGGNSRELPHGNVVMDSGLGSSANTSLSSVQPDDLPTISHQKKKTFGSPCKAKRKLKTVRESQAKKVAERRKKYSKKANSPRSPRGAKKFLLTSSLQTISSSKRQTTDGIHDELPDLFPAVDLPSFGHDANPCETISEDLTTGSQMQTDQKKQRKPAKSVCRRKKNGSDSEFELSNPKGGSGANKAKPRGENAVNKRGTKKFQATKNDDKSAAHLLSSSDEEGEASSVRKSENAGSDFNLADNRIMDSDDSLDKILLNRHTISTLTDSDVDSDKTIPNHPPLQDKTNVSDNGSKKLKSKSSSNASSQKNRERKKHVLPSLAEDEMKSTVDGGKDGESSAEGARRRRTLSASSASSTELPNISMVSKIRKRLSMCPAVDDDIVVIIEELSTPVVVKIENDVANQNDREINTIRDVSNLSDDLLRYLVNKNEKYLREIFQGKHPCWRHEDYKKGGKDRNNLTYNIHSLRYQEHQEDIVMENLMNIFCSRHRKYLDYVFKVMFPEMLIKIYMEVHGCDRDKAEDDLQDVQVEDME